MNARLRFGRRARTIFGRLLLAGAMATGCFTLRAQITGGYCLDLDGVSAQVQISSNASLTLSNRLTLEAWVYPTAAACSTILSRGDGGGTSDYILNVGYGGFTIGNMNVGFFANGQWDFSSNLLPLNAWSHVAVTYDGATKSFYINGVLDHSVSVPGTLSQSGSPIFIGRQGTFCNCNFFHGRIDEVRIWNTNRSVADISLNQGVLLTGGEPGLVAYYRFDEGSGSTALDLTGNGNTGFLTNGAAWAQVYPYTPAASALSFDGVSSYVQFATNIFLGSLNNTMTVEAWVYPTGPVCLNSVVASGSGSDVLTDYIVEIGYDGSGCSGHNLAFFAAGGWDASFSPIPSNTWTHIAVTYDGNVKQFFINGVLDRTVSHPGSLYHSGLPLYVGRQSNTCTNCNMFRGIIDEVRIWNTARTQAQIAQNKNSVSSVLGNQALVAYYQFDEGSGGVTGDSAHGYVGGLSNGPVWVTSSAPIIAPPDVYIGGQLPDNITGTSAQLHGIVHPHLEPASAWFEYGTNTSFGNMTSPTNLPAVNSFVPISSVISGLSLSTTNYYRVVALNHDGTTYSSYYQFRTLGPPDLRNTDATWIPPIGIRVQGFVDPRNNLTTWYVEYGTNISYGSTSTNSTTLYAQPVEAFFPAPLPITTYHCRLVASNVYGASYSADMTVTTPPGPPTIVSSSASEVTSNSATLNAVINPNGADTTVLFLYGLSTGYGFLAGFGSIGSGLDNVPVSVPISGLVPMTQYHFQVQAHGFSTVIGPDQIFYTSPPQVTTSAADQVGSARATLHGLVNPMASPTVGWFEYGLTPAYGLQTPPLDLGSGIDNQFPTALLSNLAPGALYNFRVAASNTVGLAYGANLTFQTAPQATITGVSSQTNGQFLLQFSGTAGINYTLQVSSNLFQWLDLTTLSPDTNGFFNYLDAGNNGPMRFYRLSNP